ncbi:MAG: aminoacetone oxidase family FAD-binding enzyme [Bdellovibrionaceae bacterium]|nr:aminoacetone oxidase family FAD-binding enzyme [Pseudobdellovibrionaceae bacterium]|tara:strand:- start:65734 stop:66963 length:1230 start_codon:yes stop_codon:yes gene_type:complete
MTNNSFDVIVIGAGAAGLFAAAQAGQKGLSVLLLEQNKKVGRKIFISGGGRCNFTNRNVTSENFVSQNIHFMKSALSRYTSQDFIALVEQHGIGFNEKKLGQLFCEERSQGIINMLLDECSKGNVQLLCDQKVKTVTVDSSGIFTVSSTGNSKLEFSSSNLVVATGGLSIPKFGSNGFGYNIAKQFGHTIEELDPALVGVKVTSEFLPTCVALSGVSVDCIAQSGGRKFRENILFTHKGLSGPAILQASLHWHKQETIELDLLPEMKISELMKKGRNESPKTHWSNFLKSYFPDRLVEEYFEKYLGLPLDKKVAEVSKSSERILEEAVHRMKVVPTSTEGYVKAEVTRGGVNVNEVSSKTFESKKQRGLFFIGEVLDVTGWLGGYNFQWAWSSAFVCAESIFQKVNGSE